MFRRDLLSIIRPSPQDAVGLSFINGFEENGMIRTGETRSGSGEIYPVRRGYLDLLKIRFGADNAANLSNFLPLAGRLYEPLWRGRSLTGLTGERFPNQRELRIISTLVRLDRGGLYLDLGCSSGLYTRNLDLSLGPRGDLIGIDISPSMLKEAVRSARKSGASPSFVRADAANLPFTDASFAGAVCGGSLNEFGDPARVLEETHRILKPGGRIAVMGILATKTGLGARLQSLLSIGGLRFFDPEDLESLFQSAGFAPEPLQIYGSVFFAGAARKG